MQESQLQELRGLLGRRRVDLQQVITATDQRVREQLTPDGAGDSQVDFNHPADMVSGDPDYEKELRLMACEREELELVDQALHRLDAGDFGRCESCGTDIGFERLRAVPFARYCIDCQSRAEQGELH